MAAVTYVARNPIFGAGAGMNAFVMYETSELGIPGLILFLMLLMGGIKSARYVQRECAKAPAFARLLYLAVVIRIRLIGFAVAAPFHPAGYHLYFYYIARLAIVAKTIGVAAETDFAGGLASTRDPIRGRP